MRAFCRSRKASWLRPLGKRQMVGPRFGQTLVRRAGSRLDTSRSYVNMLRSRKRKTRSFSLTTCCPREIATRHGSLGSQRSMTKRPPRSSRALRARSVGRQGETRQARAGVRARGGRAAGQQVATTISGSSIVLARPRIAIWRKSARSIAAATGAPRTASRQHGKKRRPLGRPKQRMTLGRRGKDQVEIHQSLNIAQDHGKILPESRKRCKILTAMSCGRLRRRRKGLRKKRILRSQLKKVAVRGGVGGARSRKGTGSMRWRVVCVTTRTRSWEMHGQLRCCATAARVSSVKDGPTISTATPQIMSRGTL